MGVDDKTLCCKCHGLGVKTNIGSMIDYEKNLGETSTCEICNGSGNTNNLFAVEFQFDNKAITYWLPMLILADNKDKATAIAYSFKKEISATYQMVSHTLPLSIINQLSRFHFQKDFSPNKRYKFTVLNMKSNSIKEPEDKPTIYFNKQLKFKPTNTALFPSSIKNAAKKNMYPIRVLKGNSSFDHQEYLAIKYNEKWSFKGMFNNN